MTANRGLVLSVAAAIGAVVGWHLAGRHMAAHQAALFSPSRLRRLAALSYLAGHGQPETVRVLRDYIAWEPVAPLRRRAMRLVRNLELELG